MTTDINIELLKNAGYTLPFHTIPASPPGIQLGVRLVAVVSGKNFLYGVDVTAESDYHELLEQSRAPGAAFKIDALYVLPALVLKSCIA